MLVWVSACPVYPVYPPELVRLPCKGRGKESLFSPALDPRTPRQPLSLGVVSEGRNDSPLRNFLVDELRSGVVLEAKQS